VSAVDEASRDEEIRGQKQCVRGEQRAAREDANLPLGPERLRAVSAQQVSSPVFA
jgi:hypothetical protein